ncbi:hypothetical protein BDV96DRAFT_563916 [Lophiotrema nucula]|uniref:Uncharacterized protein n=1 Tax=Lophiotrema nucula TaxID=690887 RepID=A0A6A5ZPV7_9PLEO|nr:hypothetical protein BDV96DRAFT_563916 [Lophiotrema nucula]
MPPIRIHKDDPIQPTAEKPDGVTPQTAEAVPAPTRTIPASVPASTTASSDPPAPQPGARPVAPTASLQSSSSSTPAAPQSGYTATHVTTESRLGGPPSQYSIPPPSDAQLAGRSTTTSTTASKPGPTTLDLGPAQSHYQGEHAGGAVETQGLEEERKSLEHPPGYRQSLDNTPYDTGLANGPQGGNASTSGDGGVVDAAWNILGKAGEALKKGEEAAWKAVRNK